MEKRNNICIKNGKNEIIIKTIITNNTLYIKVIKKRKDRFNLKKIFNIRI